jgi:hypothetical protein
LFVDSDPSLVCLIHRHQERSVFFLPAIPIFFLCFL